FLAKPCDPEALKAVVSRACQLSTLLQDPTLVETIGRVTELPVLPRVYRDLTEILNQPEVHLDDVGNVVEQDMGITAKVLQLVNSSFFGLRREVSDIRQATTYLGTGIIRDLVLSFG